MFSHEANLVPSIVDRALAQTHRAGCAYAAVPLPVLEEWFTWATMNGTRFDYEAVCMNDHQYEELPVNDDGDVLLCLLPLGHDGPCPTEGMACSSS